MIRFLQKILAYKGNDHLLDTHNIRPYSHDMKTLDTALKIPEADFDIIRVRIDSLETGKSNILLCIVFKLPEHISSAYFPLVCECC